MIKEESEQWQKEHTCPICGKHVYQCERCGGTGSQQEGNYWNGKEYAFGPKGKCNDCGGEGKYIHSKCFTQTQGLDEKD